MSVVKGKRTESNVIYFSYAYDLVEKVTKYLLSDFGIKKTYRDLKVFTYKAKMSEEDRELFTELSNKYHLDVETSYPEYIMNHYRDTALTIMTNIISSISKAYTMYPNSVYEFNVKRQHITDAISLCFDLKHTLQLAINLFTANHLEKYVPIVEMVDQEIEYLKSWRKEANKMKKTCYDNDTTQRRLSENRVIKKELSKFIYSPTPAYVSAMINYNIQNTVYYYDNDGYYRSSLLVPAVIFYDDNNNITSYGI